MGIGPRHPPRSKDYQMREYIRKAIRRREEGASAVEYGLLVVAIAAVIVVIVFALGGFIKSAFSDTCDKIGSGTSASTANCS
jgi:pilus assembly protein Flp/PilA